MAPNIINLKDIGEQKEGAHEKAPLPYHIQMLMRDIDSYSRLITKEQSELDVTTDNNKMAKCQLRLQVWNNHIVEIKKAIKYFEDNRSAYEY